jgi:hypothetical protein
MKPLLFSGLVAWAVLVGACHGGATKRCDTRYERWVNIGMIPVGCEDVVMMALGKHGIKCAFDGSVVYDVYVASEQSHMAVAILSQIPEFECLSGDSNEEIRRVR